MIQEVQRYQQTPYNLEVVPIIRDFLLEMSSGVWSDEECYRKSLILQPKSKKKESKQ